MLIPFKKCFGLIILFSFTGAFAAPAAVTPAVPATAPVTPTATMAPTTVAATPTAAAIPTVPTVPTVPAAPAATPAATTTPAATPTPATPATSAAATVLATPTKVAAVPAAPNGVKTAHVLHLAQNVPPAYAPSCGTTGTLVTQEYIPSTFGSGGNFYYFCAVNYSPTNKSDEANYGAAGSFALGWATCLTATNEICTTMYSNIPIVNFEINTTDPLWTKTNVMMTLQPAQSNLPNPNVVANMCDVNAGGTCSTPGINQYQYYNSRQDVNANGNYWGWWALEIQPGTWYISLTIWRDGGGTDSCAANVVLASQNIGQYCYPQCSGKCENCSTKKGNMTWSGVTLNCQATPKSFGGRL